MHLFGPKRAYLDYASATPLRKEARSAYNDATQFLGNPGSIHSEGKNAAHALTAARETIARELGCKQREIVFTSGLTESNNLAVLGFAAHLQHSRKEGLQGTHWVVSSIEHQSVLSCFSEIEKMGGDVSHVDPDGRGVISAEAISRVLRKETVLVSLGWANSEVGIVQPLRSISQRIRAFEKDNHARILFHVDAGQAPLYISPSVHTLGVDLFSLGSGKLYGPRGIGALYIANRSDISALVVGGSQERGLRAGTESPALAAGFARALECAGIERKKEAERLAALRDDLAAKLKKSIPQLVVNGDLSQSLPHVLNVSIPNINSEYVVLALDQRGIACSTKSACSEGRVNESHVVAAMVDESDLWRAQNTIRLSLGLFTRKRDILLCAKALSIVVNEMPVS